MSELCCECKNPFDLKIRRPILLECGCTYCLDCVHKQIKDDPNREILCPLPLHGVSTMPDNLAEKENKSILTSLLSFDDLTVFCDDHSKHKATLYCILCSIPVCPRCINSTHKEYGLIDLKKSKFQTFAANVQRLYDEYSSENIKTQLEFQSINKCTLKASELKMLLGKIQRVLGNIVSDEECQQIDLAYYLNVVQNIKHGNQSDKAEEVKAQNQITIEDIKLLINDSQIQLREEFNQTLNAIENNQRLVNDSIRTNQVKADDKIDKLQRDIETNLSQRLDELGRDFEASNLRTKKLQELVQNLTDNYSKQLQLLNSQIIETNNDFTSFKYAVKYLVEIEIKKQDSSLLQTQIPNFSRQSFKLLYRGSIDGFKASKFHQLCDNKGPTVIFMLSEYDLVLGGYASISLASPSDYKWCSDPSAFVFSLRYTYEPPKGYKQGSVEASSYLAGENKFKVLEIEVYSLQ
eukprot:403362349